MTNVEKVINLKLDLIIQILSTVHQPANLKDNESFREAISQFQEAMNALLDLKDDEE